MGKAAARKRTTKFKGDPVQDQLAVLSAKNMLVTNIISIGWRMAIMVLVPIFIGVQLDKKLGSTPSLTLAAFFIAVFAAGMLIYKTYTEMSIQAEQLDSKKTKRKLKRSNDV